MQIFSNILKELGFKNLNIQINSIGDSQCRPYYKKLLLSFLRSRANSLCSDCRRRLKENPLRILDCKNETCKAIGVQAPQAINHLCGDCHRHFKEVLEFLEEINLPYQLNPFLVRGLDYYTKTVFEFFDEGQTAIALAGGGRYDNLVKSLGGSDTAAVGAAAGVERIVEAMKKRSINPPQKAIAKVFLAQLGELAKKRSLKVLEDFRKAKIPVVESLGRDSLKVQLGRANKIEADYTVIIGQKEALEETAIVRNMKTGRQETVKIEEITVKIKEQLKRSPKKTIVKTIN